MAAAAEEDATARQKRRPGVRPGHASEPPSVRDHGASPDETKPDVGSLVQTHPDAVAQENGRPVVIVVFTKTVLRCVLEGGRGNDRPGRRRPSRLPDVIRHRAPRQRHEDGEQGDSEKAHRAKGERDAS